VVILNRFLQSNSAINILVGALLGAAACWALMNTQHNVSQHKLSALADDLQSQTYQLSEVRVSVDNKLTHVTQRVAEMQARMQRIDALGEHLTYAAGIEVGEFNFDQPIPSGGPVSSMGQLLPTMSITDLEMELNRLDSALTDRYTQLSLLQKEIRHIDHFEQTKLEGRPVHTGWLSSHYGYRSDPFTGKKAWHNGVDFAGKLGSDIIAIAGGGVTFSGVKKAKPSP